MMRPEIFPGLRQPKTELYFEIQDLINKNGGRVKLAQILEYEMNRDLIFKRGLVNGYTKEEIEVIKNMHSTQNMAAIASILDRSISGVQRVIKRLQIKGILPSKIKYPKKRKANRRPA